jgi:hypothetical protein
VGNADRHELHIAGYNQVYNPGRPQLHSDPTGRLGGVQMLVGKRMRQLVGVEVAAGMSGGPVLDMQRGFVCGVTKAQRLPNTDLGGLVIPGELIREKFQALWLENRRASAGNQQWNDMREAIRSAVRPAEGQLDADQRQLLLDVARELTLGPGDFDDLWFELTGEQTDGPIPGMSVFIDLLADRLTHSHHQIDSFSRLFVLLSFHDRISSDKLGKLALRALERQHGDKEAREALARYQGEVVASRGSRRRPVVVIRLLPDPLEPGELRLDIWRYEDRGAVPRHDVIDAGPYGLRGAKKAIIDALQETPGLLDGRPLIEFALPDDELNLPVEQWVCNGRPLASAFPVVVRLAERDVPRRPGLNRRAKEVAAQRYLSEWDRRRVEFRNGRVPSASDAVWVSCQRHDDWDALCGAFDRVPVPMAAMTAWQDGDRHALAIEAVKECGVSVLLWKHDSCSEVACAPGNGECPGETFREKVDSDLLGEYLHRLPEKTKRMRADGGNGSIDERRYPPPGFAVVWDDPGRIPWKAGPMQYPPQRVAGGSW